MAKTKETSSISVGGTTVSYEEALRRIAARGLNRRLTYAEFNKSAEAEKAMDNGDFAGSAPAVQKRH